MLTAQIASFPEVLPFVVVVLEWFSLEKHVQMSFKLGISLIANQRNHST